jgi:hypothetical protein
MTYSETLKAYYLLEAAIALRAGDTFRMNRMLRCAARVRMTPP